jgi:ketopantoate reductase
MILVGAGRVGHVLARAGGTLVHRGEPIPAAAPIVVCTRNDDVEAVIAATPAAARADLCFVQNGVLRPVLDRWGLAAPTLGVLYFAAADRSGRAEPGPPSRFAGPHADTLIRTLHALDLPAERSLDIDGDIARKLLWNVVYGLLGAVHGVTVGRVPEADVRALVTELAPVLDVPADPEPLLAYAASIPQFPAGVKEWGWRNGWVAARARDRGIPTPLHDRWSAPFAPAGR